MKRWIPIVLACLLALQPTALLWAGDSGCEASSMVNMADGDFSAPCCKDGGDSGDGLSCETKCQLACSSLVSIYSPCLTTISGPSQGAPCVSATVYTPAGHYGPAVPPPISS